MMGGLSSEQHRSKKRRRKRVREMLARLGREWKRSTIRRVEETFPVVCMWLGAAWIVYILLQSSLTPPVLVLCLGFSLWLRNSTARLRSRGGPIALLPPWAQSLLLETRPIDAMSAVAMLIDAQKGIGFFVHMLAALRLDEEERLVFIQQLPERVRRFVLAPGLLQVFPRSARNCISWIPEDEQHHLPVEQAPVLVPFADRGDSPRADEEDSEGVPVVAPIGEGELEEVLPRPHTGFRDLLTAARDFVPYLRRRDSALVPSAQRNPQTPSSNMARAVAEFNPWPTLLRVVSGRVASLLRQKLTISTLSTTSLFAGSALSLQLAVSPTSRRIAANSVRLSVVFATTSALFISGAAFATLHANSFFKDSNSSNTFSPKRARWAHSSEDVTRPSLGDGEEKDADSFEEDGQQPSTIESSSSDDEDDDDISLREDKKKTPSPWPAATAMFFAVVCARNLDISYPAQVLSPLSAHVAHRLLDTLVRIKTSIVE